MSRTREVRGDLFWAGFLSGAVLGGVAGVLLAWGPGRRTLDRFAATTRDLRGRFNGRASPESVAQAEAEAASAGPAEGPARDP